MMKSNHHALKMHPIADNNTPLAACIHKCIKCGLLYYCRYDDVGKCQSGFHKGKCIVCYK